MKGLAEGKGSKEVILGKNSSWLLEVNFLEGTA